MDIATQLTRLSESDDLKPFDCGDDDINDYFSTMAKDYQRQLLAVTYYLSTETETAFFFTLSNDKVTALESSNSFWRKIKSYFPHSKHRKDYPAVKIGRLGVSKRLQHSGLNVGTAIMQFIKTWMVTENKTGCRFITVDAYIDAVPFYERNGFKFMGSAEKLRYETRTSHTVAMFYDLKNITD